MKFLSLLNIHVTFGPQWFGEEGAENNNVTQIADFFIFKTL